MDNDEVMFIVNELLLSSSTDSDEEEEVRFRGPMVLRPRVENFVEDVVESFSDDEFRQNFRMHRVTFNFILALIEHLVEVPVGAQGRHTISAKNQLLITIWRFSTPDSYRSICSRFNVGKATAIRCVRRVTTAILEIGPRFLKWPDEAESNRIKNAFENVGFPDTIGCIDGSYIPIPEPKQHARSYINRKGFAALILQGVCDDKLMFIHTTAGQVGSCHDARVLKESEVWSYLTSEDQEMVATKFRDHTHLVGDKAYPLLPTLMTPYKNNGHLTLAQQNYNYQLSAVRSTIERAFALLKKRFRCLKFLDVKILRWGIKYIIACTILHNICILNNDILNMNDVNEEENIDDPYVYQRDNVRENQMRNLGSTKRNRIKDHLFFEV